MRYSGFLLRSMTNSSAHNPLTISLEKLLCRVNISITLEISTFKTLEMKFYTKELEANREPQGFAIKNIEFSRIKVKQL